jgi:hypothetical protein
VKGFDLPGNRIEAYAEELTRLGFRAANNRVLATKWPDELQILAVCAVHSRVLCAERNMRSTLKAFELTCLSPELVQIIWRMKLQSEQDELFTHVVAECEARATLRRLYRKTSKVLSVQANPNNSYGDTDCTMCISAGRNVTGLRKYASLSCRYNLNICNYCGVRDAPQTSEEYADWRIGSYPYYTYYMQADLRLMMHTKFSTGLQAVREMLEVR